MRTVRLAHETDFDGWRAAARELLREGVDPARVRFVVGEAPAGLFEEGVRGADEQVRDNDDRPERTVDRPVATVPARFLEVARDVALHRSEDRYALLYRLLVRLQAQPSLMAVVSDRDVADALERAKNVSRASHKMKAFVRFREVTDEEGTAYVAWFEPAHRVVEKTAPFFVRRFASMRFSILTPDVSALWDGHRLEFAPAARREDAPADDVLEDFWRTYYASIFNPARLKTRTMQGEMPRRYWRNLPEAELIPSLIADAERRTQDMRQAPAAEPRKQTPRAVARPPAGPVVNDGAVAETLGQVWDLVQGCRRCDLWRDATQGIAGEGPPRASMMLVGEQPGDQEDLGGKPFVGPAGQLLDGALQAAGIDRDGVYVTNAVKHFKFEPRGKRRLHKSPAVGEIKACRWWYEQEVKLLAPRVIVALGSTAARQVLGRPAKLMQERGEPIGLNGGATAVLTIHPSFALRAPDADARARARDMLAQDLALAASLLA